MTTSTDTKAAEGQGSAQDLGRTAETGTPAPSHPRTPAPERDWGATVFVWGVWALMMLGNIHFAVTNCSFMPFSDDWWMVPAVTGDQPITVEWLWLDEGEHRIPLPKLLVAALYKLSGGDYRVGPMANVLSLGMLAFAMMWGARRLRGWTRYTDALFPLALMTLNSERVFIGLGVSFIPSTILACLVLLIIAGRGTQPSGGMSVLTGILVLGLALMGPQGLALVPALALWLVYLGILHWRSSGRWGKWISVVVWGLTATALLLVPLYFVGLHRIKQSPPSPSYWATFRTSLEFLSFSFGWAASNFWTGSDESIPPVFGVGVLVLSLLSAALLVVVWRKQPQERPRALGLLLFLGAMAALAWAMGSARAGRGPGAGYQGRYVILATPVLCCLYFVWECYGPPRSRRLIQIGLVTALCLLFSLNVRTTLQFAKEHREQMGAAERDVLAGMTPRAVTMRNLSFVYDSQAGPEEAEYMVSLLTMLRRAGIKPFNRMAEEADAREVAFPVVPVAMNQMTWKDGVGEGHGDDPYLVFALPEPQLVRGIRVTCAYERTALPITFQAFWRRQSDQPEFEEGRSYTQELKEDAGERTILIPVNETIDQFRIDPDVKPCVIRLTKIELLVPAADHERVERLYEDAAHQHLIRQLREAVGRTVPPEATVFVAGKVDDDLLTFDGRTGRHFPQGEGGGYAGNPADDQEAIDQLEKLRAKGGHYLLFPEPAFWWLEHYTGFKQHLGGRYTRVYGDEYCIIYRLSAPGENKP
jgi:hypothetical protein